MVFESQSASEAFVLGANTSPFPFLTIVPTSVESLAYAFTGADLVSLKLLLSGIALSKVLVALTQVFRAETQPYHVEFNVFPSTYHLSNVESI